MRIERLVGERIHRIAETGFVTSDVAGRLRIVAKELTVETGTMGARDHF